MAVDLIESDIADYGRELALEYINIGSTPLPEPTANFGLIWVLSGPNHTFEESPGVGQNETRDRLVTGFELSRMVTAIRTGQELPAVTLDHVGEHGPSVFFNGWDFQNEALRRTRASGVLEEAYSFPRERLIIQGQGIRHTKDQVDTFPVELIEEGEEVVLVTDAYHLFRSMRYLLTPSSPLSAEMVIPYPSQPLRLSAAQGALEIWKIIEYSLSGDLPPIPAEFET